VQNAHTVPTVCMNCTARVMGPTPLLVGWMLLPCLPQPKNEVCSSSNSSPSDRGQINKKTRQTPFLPSPHPPQCTSISPTDRGGGGLGLRQVVVVCRKNVLLRLLPGSQIVFVAAEHNPCPSLVGVHTVPPNRHACRSHYRSLPLATALAQKSRCVRATNQTLHPLAKYDKGVVGSSAPAGSPPCTHLVPQWGRLCSPDQREVLPLHTPLYYIDRLLAQRFFTTKW
jgi:hypothetical protein